MHAAGLQAVCKARLYQKRFGDVLLKSSRANIQCEDSTAAGQQTVIMGHLERRRVDVRQRCKYDGTGDRGGYALQEDRALLGSPKGTARKCKRR